MRKHAFTLVELLVVLGIIVLLAGIIVPVGLRAYGQAEQTRVRAELQTISAALNAYKQDHGDYPRVTDFSDPADAYRGARLLAMTLIAPYDKADDGADGPGFRTRRLPGDDQQMWTADDILQGQVYGPYLKPESFVLTSDPANPDAGLVVGAAPMLLDKTKQPILYFPARGNNKANLVGSRTTPPWSYYNYEDNRAVSPNVSVMREMMLEDGSPRTTAPFVLWCAGRDGRFGTDDDITSFNE